MNFSTGNLPRTAIWAIAIVCVLYAVHLSLRSEATECVREASTDGIYVAERCLLHWRPGGSSSYRGRVYDAKTHALLVERTFDTPVPQLSWSADSVSFSRGGDESSSIPLPPTLFDRITARMP
jgi:hypothetical protein